MSDNFIDLTITSPPYDNLRDYKGYSFDFENISQELFRITKPGGVVVWIVGDQTINGSETGTSFKQALYFKEIGFNLHDTMIYLKTGTPFPSNNRYYQAFEYMFILSKNKPKTVCLIQDKKNKQFGRKIELGQRRKDGSTLNRQILNKKIKEFGVRFNYWIYSNAERGKRQLVFNTGIYTVPRGYNKGGIRITDKAPPVTSNSYEHNNKLIINPLNSLFTFIKAEKSNRESNLNYLGSIISNRGKWLKDGKNFSRNFSQGNRIYSIDGKAVTLNATGGGLGAKTGLYAIYKIDNEYIIIRKLTPIECERLQSIPDNYTNYVSNTQRYKMIGNGFTILVIIWILSHTKLNKQCKAFLKEYQGSIKINIGDIFE
jgi:hypothetical protein